MADITDPSGASLRLSNDERERAVAALQSHAGQGRLTDDELQTRIAAARAAVTRGDLTPLFADLPGGVHLDAPHATQPGPAQPAPGPQYTQPYPQQSNPPQYGQQPYGAQSYGTQQHDSGPGWGDGNREPSSRWGLLLVSVIPFVSLILFFITGMAWGYQYSWLWFLLIPLVGAITYGTGAGRRR